MSYEGVEQVTVYENPGTDCGFLAEKSTAPCVWAGYELAARAGSRVGGRGTPDSRAAGIP